MNFIHKSICLPGFITQIQQLQHDSFKRAFLIQPPGFHTVFRIEADIHRAFYLTVGPSGSLPDILVHREGRNSERGTDIRGGTLFILHDFNVLQETKLAEQHGKHIHPVCAGQKLIINADYTATLNGHLFSQWKFSGRDLIFSNYNTEGGIREVDVLRLTVNDITDNAMTVEGSYTHSLNNYVDLEGDLSGVYTRVNG